MIGRTFRCKGCVGTVEMIYLGWNEPSGDVRFTWAGDEDGACDCWQSKI